MENTKATEIKIDTTKFVEFWGHEPWGRGLWLFRSETGEVFKGRNGYPFGNSKKKAVKWAQENGFSSLEVMNYK